MNTQIHLSLVSLLLVLVLSACGPSPAQLDAAATQVAANIFATQTAQATPTSTPTLTPTLTPLPPTPTATPVPPTATPTPNVTATTEARATQTAAPIIAKIKKELGNYDVELGEGYIGWMNDSTAVKVDTYMEQKRQAVSDLTVSDFAFHTDMTWETSTGLAGCGFVLRSESDLDDGEGYRIYMFRLQNLPLWGFGYYKDNVLVDPLTPTGITTASALFSTQGSTNRITIIAQGSKLAVYANGDRMGVFTHKKVSQGILGFMALQESGQTTCTFDNSWLWVFKEGS